MINMLREIRHDFLHKRAVHYNTIDMLDRIISQNKDEIEKLEKKKEILNPPNWVYSLVDPVATEIARQLRADYEIHFLSPKAEAERVEITFVAHKDGEKYKITIVSGNLGNGELLYETNGLNKVVKPLPTTVLGITDIIFKKKAGYI